MNNQYLNEEKFQQTNKKVKKVGTIIMIGALALIVIGIIIMIVAANKSLPPMGDSNWFDASREKSHQKFLGESFIMFGIFIEFVGCMIRFGIGNRREIMAYQMQSMMPVAAEGMKEMAPVVGETAGTVMKEMAPAYKEMAKTMAPVYGEIAKEVGKGIAEGMNEANQTEEK
jgi:hypothetical protein